MNLQKMMDAISDADRRTRSCYHVTLGKAIELTEKAPDSYIVVFDYNNHSPGREMSYRGYYSDLSFEPENEEPKTVSEFEHQLKQALDQEYTGYKGGEFRMGADTPLWVATYGTTGRAIVGHRMIGDGVLELLTKSIDW